MSQDNLATACIAQIFGSELLKVQKNTRTDSGIEPQIVTINPKQFVSPASINPQRRREDEARMLRAIQMEAESSCPLPPPSQSSESPAASVGVQSKLVVPDAENYLKSIANSLDSLVKILETCDVTFKKKK